MKKALFLLPLVVLVASVCLPQVAVGKTDTFRITISGGGLTNPVEITDPGVLALSNVWSGQFLDWARTPESKPPKGLLAVEVSFFIKIAENDIRKNYVLFYYPNSSGEQGYIYLPTKGSPLWWLDAGSIMRTGRDGKWNYASPEWEALVKPILIHAQAAVNAARASQATEARNTEASSSAEASGVSVEAWTKPQRGWLYVLDPRSESEHPGSRIWLLDPESARVMGSVRAGDNPDFALSPDGGHLYVASGERDSAEVAVIDTVSGETLHIRFSDRVLYKPWYQWLPPYSPMEFTSDGGDVRILVNHVSSPEEIGCAIYQVELATQNTRPMPGSGDCSAFPSERLRSPDNAKVYLAYGPEQTEMWTGLRVLDTATERVLGDFQTSIPFWSAALSQDGKLIYAVAPEQHRVLVIDAATLQELRTIDVGRTPSLVLVVP
jgi:YVTN family beta-propeller protein